MASHSSKISKVAIIESLDDEGGQGDYSLKFQPTTVRPKKRVKHRISNQTYCGGITERSFNSSPNSKLLALNVKDLVEHLEK